MSKLGTIAAAVAFALFALCAPAHATALPISGSGHESYVQDQQTYVQATPTTCNLWDHHRRLSWVNVPIASGGGFWVHTRWSKWVILSTGPCPE